MNDTYVLQMEGIEKEYSGVKVLRGIDLQVRPGEVVSIVGENGAGKSTLMNILFGMPVIHSTGGFKGSVRLCGEEVRITSPEKAIEFGIGMVHQEFMLLPNFTVAENIKIAPLSPYDQGCVELIQNAFSDYFQGNVEFDKAKSNFETAIMERYPEITEVQWPE